MANQKLRLSYLTMLTYMEEFSSVFAGHSYMDRLPEDCTMLYKEEICPSRKYGNYFNENWDILCQQLIGLIYLRSLNNADDLGKAVATVYRTVLRMLKEGGIEYSDNGLYSSFMSVKEILENMFTYLGEDEGSLYLKNTRAFVNLIWEILDRPSTEFVGNTVIIGNYAFIEDDNVKDSLFSALITERSSTSIKLKIVNIDGTFNFLLGDDAPIMKGYNAYITKDMEMTHIEDEVCPYFADMYIASNWKQICRKIVVLLYVRSLGSSALTYKASKNLAADILSLYSMVKAGPFANDEELPDIIQGTYQTAENIMNAANRHEIASQSEYVTSTRCLLHLLWIILNKPNPIRIDDSIILGNYLLVERRAYVAVLNEDSNRIPAILGRIVYPEIYK